MNNFICVIILVAGSSFITPTYSQDKPIIINSYENTGNQRIAKNKNFNPQPLGGSCWQDLDASFVNVNNDLYGNQSYSSAYPLDDGTYGPVDLGFTFTFYGVSYTQVYINVNGNVTFGNLHSAYSAQGFPSGSVPAMIAPFWGDVDLRGTGAGANKMYVKIETGKISIQWVGVGYYNKKTDLTNTFQLILTDGNNSELGVGKNTRFAYDDMNWCVGDASGGSGGFGSNVYATVGAQSAGGGEYYQIGLFGKDNTDYDGAGGALDGVHYLDGRCFTMDLSQVNIPPIVNNLPNNRMIELCPGMTYKLESSFTAPEVSQITSTTITNTTLSDFSSSSTTGNFSEQSITINPAISDVGMHWIAYRSQDDGSPNAVSYDTLWVNVYNCGSEGSSTSLNFDGVDDYSVVHHHPALYSGGTNTYSAWVRPVEQTIGEFVLIMGKQGQFELGLIGVSLLPSAKIMINEVEYSVLASDAIELDKWSHICAVVEPTEFKIYINAELVGSSPIPGIIDVTNKPLYVGGKPVDDNYFKGRLDELALVSKACSAQEVKQLRWELSAIDSDYIRAYFKCTNDVVLTNSSSAYHGTLVNMEDPSKWKKSYGKIWSGSDDSDFSNPLNWAEGLVPVISSDGGIEVDDFVIFDKISENGFELNLLTQAEVNTLVFTANANAVVGSLGQFRVHGDMITFKPPTLDGEVLFTGVDQQGIYGNNLFTNLKIDNDVVINSTQSVKGNLTLNTGVLTTNSQDLTITSDNQGSGQVFHNSGSISGDVTMERRMSYNASSIGWHYISSPMSNMQINDMDQDLQILGLGTNVASDPFPSLYYYDETTAHQNMIKGWETPASLSSDFELFTGYIYYKYTKEEQNLRLKGEVFSGEKSKFLTHTSSGKVSSDGWNLLGNPYPCAMNWDNANLPAAMDNAMYIYDNQTDAYKVYVDGIGINGATNRIPTMTSYFVHVNSSVLFTVDNTIRVADSETKHYKTTTAPGFKLTLELNTEGEKDQTIIRTREGASINFDPSYDAYKILSSKGNNIFSLVDSVNLAINSIGEVSDQLTIPVQLECKSGVFSINIKTSTGWSDIYDVLLVAKNNETYTLSEDESFNILSNENSSTNYKVIIKSKEGQVTSAKESDKQAVVMVVNQNTLEVRSAKAFTGYQIYTLSGKLLLFGVLNQNGRTVINTSRSSVGNQAVVVELSGNDVLYREKLLLTLFGG